MMGTYGKLGLFRRPGKKEKEIAQRSLDQVGMTSFVNRQISELSGGQQQRVFIARALAQEADLYLMDEPFAGVDMATETAIFQLLQEMTSSGKTILVVHHDIHSAMNYFDWIIMLNLHLVGSGPTDQVMTEELLRKTYGGKLNLLTKVSELIRNKDFNPLKS
jgi:manganese/zinc/iron transport system ATP- binding protein